MRKLRVNIYPLMAAKNIRTVTEVARNIGMSNKAMYEIINGKTTRIDFETIAKLCYFFECDINDLFVLEKDKKVG